jgi:hypothetical protein
MRAPPITRQNPPRALAVKQTDDYLENRSQCKNTSLIFCTVSRRLDFPDYARIYPRRSPSLDPVALTHTVTN